MKSFELHGAEVAEGGLPAVRERPSGVSIHHALYDFYAEEVRLSAAEHGDDVAQKFMRFLNETPALRDYGAKMWLRHEVSLADAIAEELGLSAPTHEIRAYARFVLQVQILVSESAEPLAVLDAGLAILEHGWRPEG